MYNQLIYFIVVLLLFSIQRQPAKAPPVSSMDALYIAALFCFYIIYCRATFASLLKAASRGAATAAITHAYYGAQARFSIIAIVFLAFYLFAFNLSSYLGAIPGFFKFMTVSGITGLVIYLIHLAVIWYWSHPIHEAVIGARTVRSNFIKGHLSFTSVILIPWFLISTVTDLLQLIKMPSFMASELGQILLIAVVLLAFVLFGPWLIVRMWGCKPLPADSVKEELEAFCRSHNFRTGGFLLWPIFGGEMLTAGVVGILPGIRYILITPGLLRILGVSELKAVVAHEMGHVRKKHMLLFILIFILFIVFVSRAGATMEETLKLFVLSNDTAAQWFLSPGALGTALDLIFFVMPLIALLVIYLRYIFGFFLRNSERQADLFAMELLGNPHPLISSFEKIAFRSGRIEDLPSWHHFSIRQRIQYLVEAFENHTLVRKQNRKLYLSVIAYVTLISSLLFINMKVAESDLAKNWRAQAYLAVLEQRISHEPGNIEVLASYGGLLYEKGRYSEAETVLRATLTRDPKNAAILNNLAWLYATGPPPYRNPDEALHLALKAASINPEAHVLDTLAEAYYVNGRHQEALATIDEALSKDSPLRDHFLKQKDKFQKALISAKSPKIES
ncbi:MAG: M48 family metalloprotease [Syntrophobacteraceae bacterium]